MRRAVGFDQTSVESNDVAVAGREKEDLARSDEDAESGVWVINPDLLTKSTD
jgi:hypothetical protein